MNQDNEWYSYFSKINWSIQEINKNQKPAPAIKNMIKEELNKNVLRIVKVIKRNPRVYRVELDDGTVLRFEIMNLAEHNKILLQNTANLYHDGTPKIIFYKIVGERIFKFSEWIHGKLIAEVEHLEEVNIKTGEMFAKLNNIKYPKTGLFITVGEINNTSMIWTEDKRLVIIDQGTIRALSEAGIDGVVYKNLIKRIKYKKRIDMFLEGYSKHRDISGILKMAKENNWTFRKKKAK